MGWSLHQLDVFNTLLYRDLTNQVFMEQPPSYAIHGELPNYIIFDVQFTD